MARVCFDFAVISSFFMTCTAQLDILFMADIGHARENAELLTQPYPMGDSAFEGAFSLYEGLHDFVVRQGVRPSAVIIMGDIAYGGGSALSNNATMHAFQSYLQGIVPVNKIFPVIGNHDIHYIGCTQIDISCCYYGSGTEYSWESKYQMSFKQWRHNWFRFFPALESSNIVIPHSTDTSTTAGWLAPLRYDVNFDHATSVYVIVGLISGADQLNWNNDTPSVALDAMTQEGKAQECAFLQDSLFEGRRAGKTVFVYATHDFNRACDDWDLIKQIDVWMYGHKHNQWTSTMPGEVIVQEQRHYPARLLIGNGGYDEGWIDVVSFGHLVEEPIGNGERVRVRWDIFDTCVSVSCHYDVYLEKHCWKKCKDMPGGYDGGGGPRKATRSLHNISFTLEAPAVRQARPPEPSKAPWSGSWRLLLGSGDDKHWLSLGKKKCVSSLPSTAVCLAAADAEADAAKFTIYGTSSVSSAEVHARFAVDNDHRGPVMMSEGVLVQDHGFWDELHGTEGFGTMRPSDGFLFVFLAANDASHWKMRDIEWRDGYLVAAHGKDMEVSFHALQEAQSTIDFV
eukprot:TRINITY_DN1959_c1_g1_i3.p1 TRINITY_DN1959_c1_g1~~TRINITY_DN1959_c1_g1_i3.p1  ORF type:complete len:580 (+),score=80.02 TRINITY_DN1959_c1_g1_i3:37-1740(+)